MLQENEHIISFQPGVCKKNGQKTSGIIIVHDRSKVESEILPRYFNHASFASLRRQLNYFAFCRVGKGKQRGATYCNDQVIELQDILKLKRRAVGSSSQPNASDTHKDVNTSVKPSSEKVQKPSPVIPQNVVSTPNLHEIQTTETPVVTKKSRSKPRLNRKRKNSILNSIVPVVHLPKKRQRDSLAGATKQKRTDLSVKISPSPSINDQNVQAPLTPISPPSKPNGEADVLAGCNALLSLGFKVSS